VLHSNVPTSRALAWRNLGFAWLNWKFTVTLMGSHALFMWLMYGNAAVLGDSLVPVLSSGLQSSLWDGVLAFLRIAVTTPWPAVLAIAALCGFYYFADYSGFWPRFLAGAIHWIAHALFVIFTFLLIARWLTEAWYPDLLLIVLTSTVASILSATAFGVYLLLSLNLLKRHSNEAFSALRIEDYKCFLRLRIGKDGVLTIFPIGLKKVPKDDDAEGPRDPELLPHLIEPPIRI
jgi:hypothetical protein